MPEVSVLMPVLNTARYLPAAIESVLRQRFDDFELLAIDDGSTDASPTILQAAAQQDARVRVLCRPRQGLVATRNQLVQEARGNLLAWLDSDDQSTPDRLALQVARFHAQPDLQCLGGACLLIDPDGLPILEHAFPLVHDQIVAAMTHDIAFYFPSVMMRRRTVLDLGGFREPFAISEDYDLCLRLAEVGQVANLPQVIHYYRQHLQSTANSGRSRAPTYAALARDLAQERRAGGRDRLQRGLTIALTFTPDPPPRQNVAETQTRWAWWALGQGHLRTARKYAWRRLTDEPLSWASWRLALCAMRGH